MPEFTIALADVHDAFHSNASYQDKAHRSTGASPATSPLNLACRPRLEPSTLEVGKEGTFELCHGAGKRIRCFYYLPKTFSKETPVLMVMHGILRNARDGYFRRWTENRLPERRHFGLIVPEFSMVRNKSCFCISFLRFSCEHFL
jgi:hypothetical protein